MDRSEIEGHLKEILEAEGCFLVDIRVDKTNRIQVEVDRGTGLGIDDCVRISRQLESRLDRDKEDFALEVSSPGLDSPFKVPEQYRKNVGKEVRVALNDGTTREGELKEVSGSGIVIVDVNGDEWDQGFDTMKSARRIIRI